VNSTWTLIKNSRQQIPFWEVNSCLVGQETLQILWTQQVHYCVHMSNTSSQPEPSTSTQFQFRSLLKLLPHYAYIFQVVSFRFHNQSPVSTSTSDYDQMTQYTNLRYDTATSLQLFEHMKHERVRYWNLKHADGPYVFFLPQQFALHKIVLLTFKSIWHPMKQLLSGLHIKIPDYTGMSTLPPYHNLAQHTDNLHAAQFMICIFLQTLGTFLFCKDLHFIFWHLNLDIWRTVSHFHAKEMQVLKEESIILCLHFWKNWAIKVSKSLSTAFLPCSVSHVTYLYYLAQSVSKLERNK